jgi:ABC-2 type transport system ATP-binding protein
VTINQEQIENQVELNELTYRYGDLIAVDSLNLAIRRNEILGFLGPNGAGKTTAIRMICGLLKPYMGEVLIRGKRWTENAENRKMIGYAPQDNIFWPKLTCLEQMIFTGKMYGLPGPVSRIRSVEILSSLGLEEKQDKLASSLSGGMKRRLNLALAIVHDPEIIILDEPESGLDPQSRIMVREYIQKIAAGRTVILCTHNMDEADRLANRIAIMDYGKLLSLDTPSNLKSTIGKGDIIETEIDDPDDHPLEHLAERLDRMGITMEQHNSVLFLQGMNLVGKIPEISSIFRETGIRKTNMILRENSLEDVFIALTGRRLRQ